MHITQHYQPSLLWTGLQTIYYRVAYSAYFMLLYATTDTRTFGLIGTCFSIVYLAVTWSDFGLTQSLMPYFLEYSYNKQRCTQFFKYQAMIHAFCFFFFGLVGIIAYQVKYIPQVLYETPQHLLGVLFFIFVLENIKKVLKKNLDHALCYRITSSIEMIGISLFFVGILIAAQCTILSELSVFYVMLINSFFCVIALSYFTHSWYGTLSDDTDETVESYTLWTLCRIRFFGTTSSLASSLFSSNFLIPLIANKYGLESVGIFKLIGIIGHTLVMLLEHTFAAAGENISANSAHLQERASIFSKSSFHLFQVLSACSIFFCIHQHKIFYYSSFIVEHNSVIAYAAYFLLLVLPSLLFTYKSLFIAQQRFGLYLLIKCSSAVSAYFFLCIASNYSLSTIFLTLVSAKIITISLIAATARILWNIELPFTIRPLHLIGYIFFAGIFLLVW